MKPSNKLIQLCDAASVGVPDPEAALRAAAQTMLSHGMALEAEEEAATMLRAMGVAEPTGADGLMLAQYLKALKGDTTSAKFVREAAYGAEPGDSPEPDADLAQLSDRELYRIAAVTEP